MRFVALVILALALVGVGGARAFVGTVQAHGGAGGGVPEEIFQSSSACLPQVDVDLAPSCNDRN